MDALYYNGFKLAYRRYGASDAPAVVLIMGLGMSSAAWPTSLIAHLVREGFQVITPDNRDCGESSRCTDMKADGRNVASAVAQALLRRKVTSAYALEDMALDVERLLNHLSIRRAHIVGISMGGMIAQVAAVQSPNRVASLTSIASASGNPRTGFGRLNAVWTLLRKPDNLNISGPPTLVKQDVKYFPPQAVRERESALAVAAGRTNLSELARVNSGNEARPGTR